MNLIDSFDRIHNYVRISLTDKCCLNCFYCKPINGYVSNSDEGLGLEDYIRLVTILVVHLKVNKIRFTGGEPLVWQHIEELFKSILPIKKNIPFEICITTNGIFLQNKLDSLIEFGLDRLNISLDTLVEDRFTQLTGVNGLKKVLSAINYALTKGIENVKLNTVIINGINDEEICNFIEYFANIPITIRFIEYMPFEGNDWNHSNFLPCSEIKKIVESKYQLKELESSEQNIGRLFKIKDKKVKVGLISPISDSFCHNCNRLRISSDGRIKNCLFGEYSAFSLKEALKDNRCTDSQIAKQISQYIKQKNFCHSNITETTKHAGNKMIRIGG